MHENESSAPLSERLKASREKLGFTQLDLSRLCGFGIGQVSRYETGAQDPSIVTLRKIATVLGVSIDYLLGLSDEPHEKFVASDLNIYEREMVETFRREGWPGVFHLGAEQMSK